MAQTPLVELIEIEKQFGGVRAVDRVSIQLNAGEVVGVLGHNGAGKSCLMRILSGAMAPNAGEIRIEGKAVVFKDPNEARAAGIETIYQDSSLVPELSIARNLFLGREPLKRPAFLNRMDQDVMNEVARDLLTQVGITKDIPPTTPIGSLSGGERQSVAIARAMYFDSDLIILDEPTNNLGVAETQGVLRFVRNARESGHSCIFIAHNIHHVFQVVDRIVVLRHGGVAADDVDPNTTTIEQVERIITGVSD